MEITLSPAVQSQVILGAFAFFAVLTIAGAVFILLTRQVLYAAFSLLMSFLGLAGLFVLAGADFVAVTQVMVYVGGILVLLVFGIMLTRPLVESETEKPVVPWWGMVTALLFFGFLLVFLMSAHFALDGTKAPEPLSGVRPIGLLLLTDYVSLFEIIGLLLLVTLVGAAYVARQQPKTTKV